MKRNTKEKTKIKKIKNVLLRKYWISRSLFVTLSILAIVISAATVILNLWSIRFNKVPDTTMSYFVSIAVLTSAMSLIVSIQSFLNIQDRKSTLTNNVNQNNELLSEFKNGKELTQEDLDQILNTIN
ncbi:hypothetical protein [Mycoplasma hafezii]|uniref:hypothetical protein n=1 Tax=Mycoplasma hafezii TaxID=525886 RepID=UPI003CE88C21